MKSFLVIVKTFNHIRNHQPLRLGLIFVVTLFIGITSGFSILLLLPLLRLLNGNGGQTEGIALFFRNMAERGEMTLSVDTILVVYLALIISGALMLYWKSILDTGYQQSFVYNLRRRLFRKVILAGWPLLNRKSQVSHLQILTKEIPNMAVYYIYFLRLITAILLTTSYIVFALFVSIKYTVLITIAGMLLFLILNKYLRSALEMGKSFVESYNRLYKSIDDFCKTVKIAKVHNSEKFYYNKFDMASKSLLNLECRLERNSALPQLFYRIAGIIILSGIVYFGYHSGQTGLSSFFILIILFSRIFPQFVAINTDINMLFSNVASVEMVFKLDAEFPDNQFIEPTVQNSIVPEREIHLEKLGFIWPDGEKLFDNFSETIKAKSVTGIIGVSGRGKTTLLDIIAGLQRPDTGNITVDGMPLDDKNLEAWRSGIGYLPQDPFFVDGTLRENLVWDSNCEISDMEILTALEKVNAIHLLKRFKEGLDSFIVNYQFNFSGGECQRLSLARVLLRKPRVLMLDEATSSLDPDNENVIMEVIRRLKEEVTIIFVTHRISLFPLFDKVIKL